MDALKDTVAKFAIKELKFGIKFIALQESAI
jgi:hypothetical protein